MKILGIAEEVQRAFGGGKSPADNRFNDLDYVFQKIDEYSAKAISLSYTGSKALGANANINSKTWLEFPLTLDPGLQEEGACYVAFRCPEMVMINTDRTGFSFVGDKLTMKAFSEIQDPSTFAALATVFDELDGIYFCMSKGIMKVLGGRDITQVWVIGRPINPMSLSTTYYNPETDEYPLPDDLIPLMISLLKAGEFQQEAATPVDNKVDANPNLTK